MIRSSKTSLKFSNRQKLKSLRDFISEYRRVVEHFVNEMWDLDKVPTFVSKDQYPETWLTARALQCAGKQASGIVRGTRKKERQRLWVADKLEKEGYYEGAKRLRAMPRSSKPDLRSVQPELDSRFVEVELDTSGKFDGWITFKSLGLSKIYAPIKCTRHIRKLLRNGGLLKQAVRLSNENATLIFDIPEQKSRSDFIVGVDLGERDIFAVSDGSLISKDKDDWTLQSISEKLSRKKKGSKGFRKAQAHRENFIGWSVNQLLEKAPSRIKCENLKYVRRGRNTSRRLSHWVYAQILEKMENSCELAGVQLERVSPSYTSQLCPQCGHVEPKNRKGKVFRCTKCSFEEHADTNAARNILSRQPIVV